MSTPEYIEREALMRYADEQPGGFISNISIQFFPSADVAPVRHGHIVTTTDRWATYHQNCSECSEELPWKERPNFCHNCGAKLDLEG